MDIKCNVGNRTFLAIPFLYSLKLQSSIGINFKCLNFMTSMYWTDIPKQARERSIELEYV